MLYGWLMTATTREVASQVEDPKLKCTAHQLWKAIEASCGANNHAQMKGFSDGLAIDGVPMSLEDLIIACLIGLEVEYLTITAILQQKLLTQPMQLR
ncbi:hypothetical protein Syun_027955 [Stephania yunnanensis]|uniref:Uncharacterized protein n=1 Tax=Stephania yunnanensis TaxID=152371 RepID=A0AAP0HNA3_9MAGN